MITWTERAKAAISQKSHNGTDVTDEISVVKLSAVSSVPAEPISALPAELSAVLAVRSPSVFKKHDSSGVVIEDPDRWCWPNSEAMTGREIDTFAARLTRFTDKGMGLDAAESVADRLMRRDRE
jgi:hypothetical protein